MKTGAAVAKKKSPRIRGASAPSGVRHPAPSVRVRLVVKSSKRTTDRLSSRIVSNPGIFGGKPIVRGMRISVEMILDLLSQGVTREEILEGYPVLELDDIYACLQYAKEVVACEDVSLIFVGAAR